MPSPPLNEPCTWNVLFTCVCFMFQIYAGRTLKGSVQHWIPSWWLISRNLVCTLSTVCYLFSTGLSCIRLSISGLDSCARFWDLRSGKCIMLFEGHLKNVLSLDFSPNGWVTIHFWILFSLIHSSTHWQTCTTKRRYICLAFHSVHLTSRFFSYWFFHQHINLPVLWNDLELISPHPIDLCTNCLEWFAHLFYSATSSIASWLTHFSGTMLPQEEMITVLRCGIWEEENVSTPYQLTQASFRIFDLRVSFPVHLALSLSSSSSFSSFSLLLISLFL